jgi:hypothetical protein
MDGPTHYKEAERCIAIYRESSDAPVAVAQVLAEGQVHATLALAAATAELVAVGYSGHIVTGRDAKREDAWAEVFAS